MRKLPKLDNFKSSKRLIFIYGGIILGFIIWMVFIDTHSWIIHSELNKEIEELEVEKNALKRIIKKDKQIKDIKRYTLSDADSLYAILESQNPFGENNENK